MLFVDLDGLKMINDSFGQGAGDEALIQVAGCWSSGVRTSDVVARIGGDEFGILLDMLDEEVGARDRRAAGRSDLPTATSVTTASRCRSASRSASA